MSAVTLHAVAHGPGDAPPVLLGGSLGTTCDMWAAQLPALTGDHRVLSFDHRGHGASPVPPGPYAIADLGADVLALLDRVEIERVDYVGLSIGGMVGQWLAVHAPERIGRLVLVCTSPDTPDPAVFRERARTVLTAGSTEPIADAVLARWFTADWARTHPERVAEFRAMLCATDPAGYAGCCEAVAGHDVAAALPGVTAPTLVICGAQDEAIPASQGERIAGLVPGARLRSLSPAAHIATVEQAEAVNQLIREHLS